MSRHNRERPAVEWCKRCQLYAPFGHARDCPNSHLYGPAAGHLESGDEEV